MFATARAEMAPVSAFASGRWVYGSPRLERYNGFPSLNIPGGAGARQEFRRGDAGHGGYRREAAPGDRL